MAINYLTEKITNTKKKQVKVIFSLEETGKKIKQIVKDLEGNLISYKNFSTGESIQYGKASSNEVFASASGNGSFST